MCAIVIVLVLFVEGWKDDTERRAFDASVLALVWKDLVLPDGTVVPIL
jgi:hypothetical protein